MPRRDYARSAKSNGNKTLIIILIIICLLLAGTALWLLKEKAPTSSAVAVQVNQESTRQATQPKSALPSRPEEVYSYIRDLETREIPIGKDEKYAKEQAQLNAKQEQLLKEQKEAEENRLAAQQGVKVESPTTEPVVATDVMQPADQELAAQKAKELEQKAAEEKRLAERKKQEAERKKQELAKQQEQAQAQKDQKEKQAQQAKAAKETAAPKTPEVVVKSVSKFGLQCGAFKNRAQAENMQARLVMSGYNARINASADWNRVVVGPIGDRAAAASAQANAKAVADCVVVGM